MSRSDLQKHKRRRQFCSLTECRCFCTATHTCEFEFSLHSTTAASKARCEASVKLLVLDMFGQTACDV